MRQVSCREFECFAALINTKVKGGLGIKGKYREVAEAGGTHTLREPTAAYASDFGRESDTLTLDNTVLWEKSLEVIGT